MNKAKLLRKNFSNSHFFNYSTLNVPLQAFHRLVYLFPRLGERVRVRGQPAHTLGPYLSLPCLPRLFYLCCPILRIVSGLLLRMTFVLFNYHFLFKLLDATHLFFLMRESSSLMVLLWRKILLNDMFQTYLVLLSMFYHKEFRQYFAPK